MEIFVYRNGAQQVEEGFSIEELPALLNDASNLVWVDLRGETPEDIEQAKYILLDIFNRVADVVPRRIANGVIFVIYPGLERIRILRMFLVRGRSELCFLFACSVVLLFFHLDKRIRSSQKSIFLSASERETPLSSAKYLS